MSIEDLHREKLLLLKCRSGSHAYGLATATSDEDFRGVYFLPPDRLLGFDPPRQISDATNDEVYYELGRFVELLMKANPTALELLATEGESVLLRHPVMNELDLSDFLTRGCRETFAGYARSQIRKARGLNKKVHQPHPKERKPVEAFCAVLVDGRSRPLLEWAREHAFDPGRIGLAKVDKARGMYALYYDVNGVWGRGVTSGPRANEVQLSNVPKDAPCLTYLSFNKDGYSVYCRGHREYWDWVADRNDTRYEGTLAHGRGYDAKNMMHTLRLLDMAVEIFEHGELRVDRPNREFLLSVKAGRYPLGEVLAMADERLAELDRLAERSTLPDAVDREAAERTFVAMRRQLYGW